MQNIRDCEEARPQVQGLGFKVEGWVIPWPQVQGLGFKVEGWVIP